MLKKLSNGYKIASPGLITALVFFFMPWVLESCGTEPMRQYTGWQMAIGNIGTEEGGYGGNPFVLLSFIALLVLVTFVIRSARRASLTRRDTYGVLLMSVLVLVIFFQQFLLPPPKGFNRELLYGIWGYLVGWLLILIGGVMNTVERISESIGISKKILYEWTESDAEFTTALGRLRDAQENDLLKTGAEEDYFVNSMMIALLHNGNTGSA